MSNDRKPQSNAHLARSDSSLPICTIIPETEPVKARQKERT